MDDDELIELGADLCEKCDNRQKLLLARSLLLSISKSGSDEVAKGTVPDKTCFGNAFQIAYRRTIIWV